MASPNASASFFFVITRSPAIDADIFVDLDCTHKTHRKAPLVFFFQYLETSTSG